MPLVPLLSLFTLRQRPALGAAVGIVLSVVGLTLLSINHQFDFSLGVGEFLLLGCACAFALYIVVSINLGRAPIRPNLSIVQLAVTALLSFALVPFAEKLRRWHPCRCWYGERCCSWASPILPSRC